MSRFRILFGWLTKLISSNEIFSCFFSRINWILDRMVTIQILANRQIISIWCFIHDIDATGFDVIITGSSLSASEWKMRNTEYIPDLLNTNILSSVLKNYIYRTCHSLLVLWRINTKFFLAVYNEILITLYYFTYTTLFTCNFSLKNSKIFVSF